ncbi:PQQ-dependent sugar dehydrogenase [Marinobacter sp. V034]|uniref:PQQ-dependent sugar dehydrogenase n=1 Tax=Marinobacter sp. V034 TaxID=3459610 RepID=UPI004044F73C
MLNYHHPIFFSFFSRLLSGLCLGAALPVVADTLSSDHQRYQVQTIADGLDYPWSITFLPNGEALVTERAGQLRRLVDNQLQEAPVSGVPEVAVGGQGGLFDVIADPDFADNRRIYLSYAHGTDEGKTTRVARAQYRDGALSNLKVIFEALPRSGTSRHFGGRMAFDDGGHLYISVGDRGQKSRAQDTANDAGGVHRITIDGEPAMGNPFLFDDGARDTLFTYGNRNIQGMTRHPQTNDIWTHEHGPRGGDEVNILQSGTNYGWPAITYGIDYGGKPITDKTALPGMAQPLHYWDPSIAPSGMAFYTGEQLPGWQGDLFVGALKFQKIVRLRINDKQQVTEEEDLLADAGHRIRDIRQGPDGALWVLTDASNGKVLKITAP